MSDPDNDAEPAEGDAFAVQPVSFGELARWRDRALAAEAAHKEALTTINRKHEEAWAWCLVARDTRRERDSALARVERLGDLDIAQSVCCLENERRAEKAEAELTRLRAVVEAARELSAMLVEREGGGPTPDTLVDYRLPWPAIRASRQLALRLRDLDALDNDGSRRSDALDDEGGA